MITVWQVYQLHVRGRQLGTDLAAGRASGLEHPAAHPRSDGLRAHLARRRPPDRLAGSADHPRENPLQAERARRGIRSGRHPVQDAQSGNARPAR